MKIETHVLTDIIEKHYLETNIKKYFEITRTEIKVQVKNFLYNNDEFILHKEDAEIIKIFKQYSRKEKLKQINTNKNK